MKIVRHFGHPAGPEARFRKSTALAGLLGLLTLGACGGQPDTPVSATTPGAPTVQAVAFDQAVLNAANAVLASAPVSGPRQVVVIDPLVDGVTGEQTAATQAIGARIVALARERYPQFDIQPFSPQAVSRAPYVMVGTFTPVNAQGQTAGNREAFRFCLVMADLRTGKTVAKGVARARMEGVDSTPIGFFRDSSVFSSALRNGSYTEPGLQSTQPS